MHFIDLILRELWCLSLLSIHLILCIVNQSGEGIVQSEHSRFIFDLHEISANAKDTEHDEKKSEYAVIEQLDQSQTHSVSKNKLKEQKELEVRNQDGILFECETAHDLNLSDLSDLIRNSVNTKQLPKMLTCKIASEGGMSVHDKSKDNI